MSICLRFKFLDLWSQYLKDHHKRSIPKDTWNLLLDFATTVNDDFGRDEFDHMMTIIILMMICQVTMMKKELGLC